jgi:hypothetical protein
MASSRSKENRRLKALQREARLNPPPPPAAKKALKSPASKVEEVVPMPPAPTEPTIDYSSMTKSQIQEVLKERGITYLPQSTKRILLGILKDA